MPDPKNNRKENQPTHAVTVWDFRGKPVRTVEIEGVLSWYAKDSCDALGIVNATTSMASLDDDEKSKITVFEPVLRSTESGVIPRTYAIVTESGLYSLIFKSRKPEAKAFRRWVTHEVLPSLRKTGSYSMGEAFQLQMQGLQQMLASFATRMDAFEQRMEAERIRSENAQAQFAAEMRSEIRGAGQHTIGGELANSEILRPLRDITSIRVRFAEDPKKERRSVRKALENRLRSRVGLAQRVHFEHMLKDKLPQAYQCLREMREDAEYLNRLHWNQKAGPVQGDLFAKAPKTEPGPFGARTP